MAADCVCNKDRSLTACDLLSRQIMTRQYYISQFLIMIIIGALLSGCSGFGPESTPTPRGNSTPISRRPFLALHVYSTIPGTVDQYYDTATDTIRGENVWVFRSSGHYSAVVKDDGQIRNFSGVYSFDDVGDDMIFSLETNGESHFDKYLYTIKDFSYVEWRRKSGVVRYFLATNFMSAH
jgi:hypothetical protein